MEIGESAIAEWPSRHSRATARSLRTGRAHADLQFLRVLIWHEGDALQIVLNVRCALDHLDGEKKLGF
jgi:hypothetical protein